MGARAEGSLLRRRELEGLGRGAEAALEADEGGSPGGRVGG